MTVADQYQLRAKGAPMDPAQYLPIIYPTMERARAVAQRLLLTGAYGCVDIMRVSAPGVALYTDPVKHYVSDTFLTQVQYSPARRANVGRSFSSSR